MNFSQEGIFKQKKIEEGFDRKQFKMELIL